MRAPWERGWLEDGLLLALILAAGRLLLARSLDTAANYDEGVYLASLDALRHGQTLGSDVFASQPPAFYVLLRLVAFVFGSSVEGARHGFLALALVAYAAAYALGRELGGRAAGLAAAALLVIAPVFGDEGVRVSADVPSVSLALVALACSAAGFRGRNVLAVLGGAAFAAAVSVKLLAIPAVVPLVALAVARRAPLRSILLAAAGAAAVALALVGAYAGVLGSLWHDAVSFHDQARNIPGQTFGGNVHQVLHSLDFHTPFGWLVPAGALAALIGLRRGALSWSTWSWVAMSAAFLVWQRPLLGHHFVLIQAALAMAAGIALARAGAIIPGRFRLVGALALALALAAGYGQERRRLARNDVPEPPQVLRAAALVERVTSPADLVATDLPIVAHLAHRRVPGELVDTSFVRLASGSLTPAEVLRTIDESRARAVVVGRGFQSYPGLLAAFAKRFPDRRTVGDIAVFLP